MTKKTILALASAGALLLGWEAYTLFVGEGTISEVMYGLAKRYPIVPFLAGVLIGHFWWPLGRKEDEGKN